MREEIATALERKIHVLPVLVEGATVPAEADLPERLSRLARLSAAELDDKYWEATLNYLLSRLEKRIAKMAAIGSGGGAAGTRGRAPSHRHR